MLTGYLYVKPSIHTHHTYVRFKSHICSIRQAERAAPAELPRTPTSCDMGYRFGGDLISEGLQLDLLQAPIGEPEVGVVAEADDALGIPVERHRGDERSEE